MKNIKQLHMKLIFTAFLLSVLAALSQAEPNGEMEALSDLRAEYLDQRSYWRNYHDANCKENFETDQCRTARGVAEIYDGLAEDVSQDVKANQKRRRSIFQVLFNRNKQFERTAAAANPDAAPNP